MIHKRLPKPKRNGLSAPIEHINPNNDYSKSEFMAILTINKTMIKQAKNMNLLPVDQFFIHPHLFLSSANKKQSYITDKTMIKLNIKNFKTPHPLSL